MANIVYGPYVPGASPWTGTTGINTARLNNFETAASVALHSLNPNLSGPFVHSGITCTKDGTNANQLDIASGYAFVTMSDGTTGSISVAADNTHTTSTPSTTYHLYLQPDGTWYWSTSNTPATNSLPICTVATDGSGNISTVTDLRHTAGSPGIPYTIAKNVNLHVTSTADALPISTTAPVQGLYRVTMAGTYGNSTTGVKIVANVGYASANGGGTPTQYFMTYGGGVGVQGEFLTGSQATGMTTNNDFACSPIDIYVAAGGLLRVHYIDGSGTPNDWITTMIQRIA